MTTRERAEGLHGRLFITKGMAADLEIKEIEQALIAEREKVLAELRGEFDVQKAAVEWVSQNTKTFREFMLECYSRGIAHERARMEETIRQFKIIHDETVDALIKQSQEHRKEAVDNERARCVGLAREKSEEFVEDTGIWNCLESLARTVESGAEPVKDAATIRREAFLETCNVVAVHSTEDDTEAVKPHIGLINAQIRTNATDEQPIRDAFTGEATSVTQKDIDEGIRIAKTLVLDDPEEMP